ncbi:MAG: 2-hydroxyacyl-CoA dehydratase [Phycisphaerae bacterium]|nr:2-hydroxyacyl-CoA dehydratase [Phycisphaerae bacterium]
MTQKLRQITLDEWDGRYEALKSAGLAEPFYGGKLSRHAEDGDYRLRKLMFDDSAAALRLWNFLLTEEERLTQARSEGKKIVGVMKDLGTTAVMANALDNVVAFYPDGAWWIPCVMENSDRLLAVADSLGVDESFCPVRAMLGAFVTGNHFPIPDLLTCSVGATCDDFSAIAQRLEGLGHTIVWWEIPHRRGPEQGEQCVTLPGGTFVAAQSQVDFVRAQLVLVQRALEEVSGVQLDDAALSSAIARANDIRRLLSELRRTVFTASRCPMPALEMLIAEMLAIHYCSDREETAAVLEELGAEVQARIAAGVGFGSPDAVKVFWVNPVADLRVMNLLEQYGARICGTEYMFTHALDLLREDVEPLEALALAALADPMAGSAVDRAARIAADARTFGAEAVIISRIPGASHCAVEGRIIAEHLRKTCGLAVLEIEIPPLTDAIRPAIATRIEALVETIHQRRQP